ncbi:MAG TPA: D-2-hydroxyacid dehydrogenase [Stellaceae bacterium]|nr:D-2-hydroxyacid dehydrogenase [Stellaceae bacterium]
MTKVVVLLTLPEETRRRFDAFLRERFDIDLAVIDHHSKLAPLIEETDVLMSFGATLGPEADRLMARAGRLKWIQCLGTGLDNIIDLPSLRREVIVTSLKGIHGSAVSEAVFLAMLALTRDLPRTLRAQQKHQWDRWTMRLVEGRTVGILGVGAIAAALAPRCQAFGMRVVGITATPRAVAGFDRIHPRAELLRVVPELDYLVLLVALAPETRHIVDARVLSAMRKDAYLVNVARGGIVDEAALLAALRERRIAGAMVDVFATEPLPPEHPFWTLDNLIVTPHVAGFNEAYYTKAFPVIEANLRAFLGGDVAAMTNVAAR